MRVVLSVFFLVLSTWAFAADKPRECTVTTAETLAFLKSKEIKVADEKEMLAREDLDLGGKKVTDQEVPKLCTLTNLKGLKLFNDNFENSLTGETLDYLGHLSHLEFLDLDSNRITAKELYRLSPLTQLKNLRLYNNPLGGDGIEALADLPALDTLYLHNSKIDDEALVHLAKLSVSKSLRHLWLPGNPLTDKGLKHLGELTQLEDLDIRGCGLTSGEGLRDLTKMTELKYLQIGNTPMLSDSKNVVKTENFAPLSKLEKLVYLNAQGLAVDDDGLKAIGQISTLTSLNVFGNSITPTGLVHLHGLKQLKWFNYRSRHLKSEEIPEFEELKKVLPKLQLSTEFQFMPCE